MEDGTYCITDFRISTIINKINNHNTVSVSEVFLEIADQGTESYVVPEILQIWERFDEEEKD